MTGFLNDIFNTLLLIKKILIDTYKYIKNNRTNNNTHLKINLSLSGYKSLLTLLLFSYSGSYNSNNQESTMKENIIFKPQVVKTEADLLMKLLEDVKEISMSDAARKLGVPQQTLEAWATFLEEEGMLSIKYKFTTPYLIYVPKGEKLEEPELPLIKKKGIAFKPAFEKKAVKIEKEEPLQPSIKKEIHVLKKAEDINFLLDKAYEHLKKGEFENAQEVYNQIKSVYYALPKDFMEKKRGIEQSLVKLNKDLGLKIDRFANKRMDTASKKIKSLLRKADQDIKRDRIDEAIKSYHEMRSEFEKLPEGFFKEKKELQKHMIRLYEYLSKMQKQRFSKEFYAKEKRIRELIKRLKECIVQGNINYGMSLYEEIGRIYQDIPKGFLDERIKLQEDIFEIYDELIKKYKDVSKSKLDKNSVEIRKLIKELRTSLHKNQFGVADRIYENIKLLYSQLPTGFLKLKTDLQLEILKAYEELTTRSDDVMTKSAELKLVDLNRMLDKAFRYAKSKRFESAQNIYNKAVEEYNQLPPGFSQKKAELRRRILELYRQNITNIDTDLLKTTTQATNNKYQELMHILVQIHKDIENKKFEAIEIHFNELERLFTELPVGFVEKNPALVRRINLLRKEFNLYKDTLNLVSMAKQKNPPILSDKILEVQRINAGLRKTCPEDKALFDFVEQNISQIGAVREKSKQTEKTKQDVHEMIASLKASAHSEPRKVV